MFGNKSEKNKQFLHIEIEESQGQNLQEQQQIDDEVQQEEYVNEGTDQNLSYDEDNNDDNDQFNERQQQQDDQFQNSQESEQNSQQSFQPQTYNKYKSINDQHYLIQEDDHHSRYQSTFVFKQKQQNSSIKKLNNPIIPLSQQKDQEVQKIIQDVLIRRKQKQKQKQLLQSIIKSQKKTSSIQNYLNFSNKPKESLISIKNQKQQQNLKNYYSLIKKCKQLQTKIAKMIKKQQKYEKQRQNKQKQLQKQKKSIINMSERQKSLQKIKKRLQKALSLNQNLAKRVKLQKSQLNSIFIMSSKSQSKQVSINQESTIKNIQNPSIMSKNKQKYYAVQDTFRSSPQQSVVQISNVGPKISKNKSKNHKKSQNIKQKQNIEKQDYQNDLKKQNLQHKNYNKPASLSPAKYKSPILQFNSYLIDESQYISPSINNKKENIYIEDDLISQKTAENHLSKSEKQSKLMIQQLKELMEKYLTLELQEKTLQQKIQNNSAKIKDYETKHYHQIVDFI